ncbi:MAG TPA: alanine racemase [Myxococcales bacterium]|jgi:D-serine deaminase-like pyridoxal phosphate-dependent protein
MDETQLERALAPSLDRLLTPALVIDLDAVAHNAKAVLARVGNPRRWRPHVKTVKQAAVVKVLLEAGVRSFKCATPAELELVLVAAGPDLAVDALLAYPPNRALFGEALSIASRFPKSQVLLLADSPDHLGLLEAWACERKATLRVLLDVDTGMARTGRAAEEWRAAAPLLSGLQCVRIAGLHGYEGHLRADQQDEANAGYEALCQLAGLLPGEPAFIVTSGTPTFAHALAHPGLCGGPWTHQVSPGTVVLSDLHVREAARMLGLVQAAFVASRVVSTPRHDRVTLDAGSKSLSPDRPAPNCAVVGWPGLEPLAPSEEHLPVRVVSGPKPSAGLLLFLIPDHVCTTVNLHSRALLVRGGELETDAPVDAAGHRLWSMGGRG